VPRQQPAVGMNHELNCNAIELPYVEKTLSMFILLPGLNLPGQIPQAKREIPNCSQTVSPMLSPGEYKRETISS